MTDQPNPLTPDELLAVSILLQEKADTLPKGDPEAVELLRWAKVALDLADRRAE
jgi:hypothetical protein